MRILFLSQIVPFPPHGGVLQRGYNILREIGKHNEVYLLAFVHPEHLGTFEKLEEARSQLNQFCASVEFFPLWPKQSKAHKVLAFAAGFFYPKPFSTLAHKSAAMEERIQFNLREHAIDLLHCDTIGLAPYRTIAGHVPAILTHHNIESTLMARRAKYEKNPLARYYVALQANRLRRYEIQLSPLFDVNVMVSRVDEQELLEMTSRVRTVVVPNGVDTDYFSISVEPLEQAIVYTGGMNQFANRDAVLHMVKDIWPLVRAKIPAAVFHVVGRDPPKELIEASQKDGNIVVHGFVDDVRPLVAKSAVCVVPLRVGGGTRLKVLNSLAQGKAIVSTSVGCEGIEVTNGLDICIEDQDHSFAERVVGLLQDPDRCKELGLHARLLAVEKYRWALVAQTLEDAYTAVAQRRVQ